jgi:hypothetical protein
MIKFIDKPFRMVLEYIINYLVDHIIIWPFYVFIRYRMHIIRPLNSNGISILALNVERFRGDLESLSENGFTIFKMPYAWQTRIFYAYKDRDDTDNFFLQKTDNKRIKKDRTRVRKYIKKLLKKIFSTMEIDCTIGANLFYNQDIDWGSVSSDLGYPYIVLHRENLVVNDNFYDIFIERAKKLKIIGFSGDSIVFHNNVVSDIYKEYSGVPCEKIHAFGAIRMDSFISKINTGYQSSFLNNKKVVTFFYFHPRAGILSEKDFGFYNLHDHVLSSFILLAKSNPGIEFIIKHKGLRWEKAQPILDNLQADCINNLNISGPEDNAQEIIFKSTVITGFCSTAVLESAIAAKPIVFPLFDEALENEYISFLCFKDCLNMFDIARSVNEYSSLIMKRLEYNVVDNDVMKLRRTKFEELVSPLSGDASKKYRKLIEKLCS